MSETLELSGVPDLPQRATLMRVAQALWADPDVMALWLGGSLARGEGDAHSDVDLRIALPPSAYSANSLPASARILTDAAVVTQTVGFGPERGLFHMLLDNGEIYDVLVQTVGQPPIPERRLVLGCRDPDLAAKLSTGEDPSLPTLAPADPAQIRQLVAEHWLGLRKHRKVLDRGLDILAWDGDHRLRTALVQLYHVLATGTDCGPIARMNIHAMSPVVRTIQAELGEAPLAVLGLPARTHAELIGSAAAVADEVARIGRLLAERLGFDYPEKAEAAARAIWSPRPRFTE